MAARIVTISLYAKKGIVTPHTCLCNKPAANTVSLSLNYLRLSGTEVLMLAVPNLC